jgi:crotonobetainyl-CoA:carnitine CoA-transferase CaiB-like acyl-CoA transferase
MKQAQALTGIKVFDLTRVLAGPTCTQILGDLGADVVKIEQPGVGDITRTWGPPFEKDQEGNDTTERAFYLSCNRNKRSLELDYTSPEGKARALTMIAESDILVENFKTGTLAKYGLDYESVKQINSRLIYCSITGFGQGGPYAQRPGYDFQIQGMSGLMSLNGEVNGDPMRAGISLADISTGVYSAVAILAAVYQRTQTGRGQFIDMSLLDCQVAMLSFAAQSALLTGEQPERVGNGHPNIVPYGSFPTQDGFVVIAIGTNEQFAKFCDLVKRPELITDPRFQHNKDRVANRHYMLKIMEEITLQYTRAHWLKALEEAGVPCGPVNSIPEMFEDPQVLVRGLAQQTGSEGLKTIASALRLEDSPVDYKKRPPSLGT